MNKKFFGLAALALTLGIIGMSAGQVLAYRGDPNVTGPNFSEERHTAMQAAFNNNDYDAWLGLMKGVPGRVTEVITRENFSQFTQIHKLMLEGKVDEAKALRTSLGLGLGVGPHDGSRGVHRGVGR